MPILSLPLREVVLSPAMLRVGAVCLPACQTARRRPTWLRGTPCAGRNAALRSSTRLRNDIHPNFTEIRRCVIDGWREARPRRARVPRLLLPNGLAGQALRSPCARAGSADTRASPGRAAGATMLPRHEDVRQKH